MGLYHPAHIAAAGDILGDGISLDIHENGSDDQNALAHLSASFPCDCAIRTGRRKVYREKTVVTMDAAVFPDQKKDRPEGGPKGRLDYSAGAKKEMAVAPVLASSASSVMGATSMDRVSKVPS